MRVLFIPAAVASHAYPMVPLAWAFRTAGHDVRFATQPSVVDQIVRSGLMAVPVGDGYDLLAGVTEASEMARRETGYVPIGYKDVSSMPDDVRQRYVELRTLPHVRAAEAMADDVVAFARDWRPDLVVTDPMTMVAPLVAEVVSAPLVHHLWGPQPPSLTKLPGFGAEVERWPDGLLRLFDRFGAQPRAGRSVGTVDPCPPSLQTDSIPNRLPTQYLPYNGSAIVPDWLRVPPERSRICVSWMTARTEQSDAAKEHPVATLAAALAGLDVEVVVTVRAADRAELGPVPDGVRLVEELPLQLLFPTCAVAVNHGGAGTVLTAVYYGVPQVVVPRNQALVINAERIAASGAGASFPAHEIDPEAIVAAVASMLSDDTWRKAAQAVREENLAQPTPAEVRRTIEELAWS